ncbi:MAG: CotH kinase family protein [Clostridia bacterium]|nr:CotH kinase family protein [Clostridia bacterium]
MKRWNLLLAMALLGALVAAVVVFASPYAPVVQPVRDIEEIWAIEDARQESETPLVTRLENNGVPLGYDAGQNTFYCTLGPENGDAWPQLHLTAPGADGIEICFVDDYAYDWCRDAIRENYAYQIIAYDDGMFSYAQVVFTGLPMLSLTTAEAVPAHVDVPAQLAWSYDAERSLETYARTHKRGASTLFYGNPKVGYKIEFTRGADGRKKTQMHVEGLGLTDELVLIPCLNEEMMQDRLCWDLYGMLADADEPFGRRDMFYTELIVNGDYEGVFLAMRPFDYAEELNKAGKTAAQTDSIYRTIVPNALDTERPIYTDAGRAAYELYYTHRPVGRAFEPLTAFARAFDAAYEESASGDSALLGVVNGQMDVDSFLRYFLYVQACGLQDNLINNMYVWAHASAQGLTYRLVPWDLNVSWGSGSENYEDQRWHALPILDRTLEIDCGGEIRRRMLEIWREMRAEAFTAENVERLVAQYTAELEESGAYYRDAVRWGKSSSYPDGYSICAYAQLRFDMLDARIEEIAAEENRGRTLEIMEYETRAAD